MIIHCFIWHWFILTFGSCGTSGDFILVPEERVISQGNGRLKKILSFVFNALLNSAVDNVGQDQGNGLPFRTENSNVLALDLSHFGLQERVYAVRHTSYYLAGKNVPFVN